MFRNKITKVNGQIHNQYFRPKYFKFQFLGNFVLSQWYQNGSFFATKEVIISSPKSVITIGKKKPPQKLFYLYIALNFQ